jgi:hypothetical protein
MTLRTALAASMLAAVTFAACGDDDDDGNGADAGGESAASLSITVDDKGIRAPESAPAGLTTITLENAGEDNHEAQLIGIEGSHTDRDVLEVITGEGSRIPDWFAGGGGVGTAEPGETRTVTQVLEPGTYAIIDTGADKPQSAPFEVTGGASDAELPDTEASVTASEYTFEASGLKPGDNTFRFANAGEELHHLIASPVKDGTTAEQVLKFFETEEKSADPFTKGEEGDTETAVLDRGDSQVVELELAGGTYAFMCFIPDRAGGAPHSAKGMITIEEIQ